MGDPDFVVVDGVPVMLPSYDEAVSSSLNALAPGYSATTDQGHILETEDQNPPAYPGPRITDTLPSEFETCDSRSGSSELLQSSYPSPACQAAALPGSDRTDVSCSTAGEAASTSPRIDIADGESCIGPIGKSIKQEPSFVCTVRAGVNPPDLLLLSPCFCPHLNLDIFKTILRHALRASYP